MLKNSIAIRLLRIVFSIYLSITILMTLAQMFNEYLIEENDVKHLLKHTQLVFESSLIDALWNFNDPQIKASEKGMIQIPVVVGVKVFDMVDNKFVIYRGLVLNQQGEIIDNQKKSLNPYLHLLEHQFTLVKNGQKIGEVTLYSSNQVVFDKVKYNFLVTIISAVIKTILLWVLFLWAFKKYLIRQLDIFCHTMENVDIDRQTKSALTLETFGSHELIRLEYLFNNMLTRIIDNKVKLNILNKTLEEKIVTRTQELEKSKVKAETANRAKSAFLASMSHELRTPLNGILGFAQILQRDLSITTKQQHGLNIIEQSGNHLLGLINDVLVVDDNLENRAVLIDLLAPLGCKVELANDGHEGLKKAIEWQPDAIITDLIMPKMDGFELIQRLRQSSVLKEKVIIASSASVSDADKDHSLTVGSDAFLPKPIQVERLLEQLQYHLDLTWVYGDKVQETAEENHTAPMVFPPITELKKLYELTLMADIDGLEEQVAILAKDVKLKAFVTKMQALLKKYQVGQLKKWLEEVMTDSE